MSDHKCAATDSAFDAPFVSVVIPSYNHGKFIEKAINSVLFQCFSDFELLISDDASSDNSWEIIQRFRDPRIRRFRQERNLGPVGNLVFLIKEARGKYVALLNSDDYWLSTKLSKQVAVMEADPRLGACFTWADLVDETGCRVTGVEEMWNGVFRQPNRSQPEWLRYFFFNGNCICHPSILIRRIVYNHLGFYNPGLFQLPDFEMWIRLVKKFPIRIIEESLVCHLRTGVNTSAHTPETIARNLTELLEIFEGFFQDVSDEFLIVAFGEHFRLKGVPMTADRLKCEKLFLLLDGGFAKPAAQAAAIRGFYQSLCDPEIERILANEYHFSVFDYYQLTGKSGFGHFCLLATNQVKPSLLEIGHAVWQHLRKNCLYKYSKKIGRRLGFTSR